MKNFKEYLAESERVYDYRIKFVGDLPADMISALKEKLQQFEVVKFGTPKTTPVQAKPADFPAYENDRVTSIDVTFRYPAIDAQIRQLVQLLGGDPNKVLMQTTPYDDSMSTEKKRIDDQPESLLADTDYPPDTPEQKALIKDYSADPFDHAVVKNAYKSNFTVAGGKTPKAQTTNDLPMGDTSPMSTVKRPARPATGRNPRG